MNIFKSKATHSLILLLACCLFSAVAVLANINQNSFAPTSALGTEKPASKTVIYIVRHAEKASGPTMMSANAMTADPDLSPAGQQRAQVLKKKLGKVRLQALLATKYRRTQQTLQPLSDLTKLPIQQYDAQDAAALAQRITQEFAGKTILVAGHSNTVLPIIEALGGKKPFSEIADHQYDYLFKVTLRDGKETQVDVRRYGAPSVAPAK